MMIICSWIVILCGLGFVLGLQRASRTICSLSFGITLLLTGLLLRVPEVLQLTSWLLFAITACVLHIKFIRLRLTAILFKVFTKISMIPSKTEMDALEAGSVGWEGELFSGMPNWHAFKNLPKPALSARELAFIDGPLEEVCAKINDWEITHVYRQIPDDLWSLIKDVGLLGMIIPREYGGLEFSHQAHAHIISKLASVSVSVGTSVSVPNSLGPAELLLNYGTQQQKDYYLPRLAKGEEIPCFALTSPDAGSDAAAMMDYGVIIKHHKDGIEHLAIKLNWNKRYITLAPIASVLGLAFKLYDPEHLLGDQYELGITCALIPVKTSGVTIGRYHAPLNAVFANGPTQGKDVVIGLDQIIGGTDQIGNGWRMLMECLAVGRCISIPSMVAGGAKKSSYTSAIYCRIRKQFNLPIASFEGVQEVLAKIYGYTYLIEATRHFSLKALDSGEKPTVASAICKYHISELSREVIIHAMDVHGGKGICLGPKNYMGNSYDEAPIGITVEGANILTRSMIIFGQGMVRCHPYVHSEMKAAANPDKSTGLHQFDGLIFSHMGYILSNFCRSFILSLSKGRLARVPSGKYKSFYQQLSRYSATFSLLSEVMALYYGASRLKRKEFISARLGDMLSYMYMGSALMDYYEESKDASEVPVVDWCCSFIESKIQAALIGIIKNIPNRFLRGFLKCILLPYGQRCLEPLDKKNAEVVSKFADSSFVRDKLTKFVYTKDTSLNAIGTFDDVLNKIKSAEKVEKFFQKAIKNGDIFGVNNEELLQQAVAKKIITEQEKQTIEESYWLRRSVTDVDDFSAHDLQKKSVRDNNGNMVSEDVLN